MAFDHTYGGSQAELIILRLQRALKAFQAPCETALEVAPWRDQERLRKTSALAC